MSMSDGNNCQHDILAQPYAVKVFIIRPPSTVTTTVIHPFNHVN